MTAFINKLKDKTGNQQLPVTHERAVRDDNGTTLESKMQNLEGAMDKAYVASSDNGMGRITLKKNMVSGVNTLTQAMMQATNTIYVIQYDFTLGENITVPANCVLEFDGGKFSGGICISNSTVLKGLFDDSKNCLYGVFYNEIKEPLLFQFKQVTDIKQDIVFVEDLDALTQDDARFGATQSLLEYNVEIQGNTKKYFLIFTSELGASTTEGGMLVYDFQGNKCGSVVFNNGTHANSACIRNGIIYLLTPQIHYFNIDNTIAGILNGTITEINLSTINIPGAATMGYDTMLDKFILNNREEILVYDSDFNSYTSISVNYLSYLKRKLGYTQEDNGIKLDYQQSIVNNGVFITIGRFIDNSSDGSTVINFIIFYDLATKNITDAFTFENIGPNAEYEGICLVSNELYSLGNIWYSNQMFYVGKLSLSSPIVNFSEKQSSTSYKMYSNDFAETIYINNTYSGLSDGSFYHPFKSLKEALLMTNQNAFGYNTKFVFANTGVRYNIETVVRGRIINIEGNGNIEFAGNITFSKCPLVQFYNVNFKGNSSVTFIHCNNAFIESCTFDESDGQPAGTLVKTAFTLRRTNMYFASCRINYAAVGIDITDKDSQVSWMSSRNYADIAFKADNGLNKPIHINNVNSAVFEIVNSTLSRHTNSIISASAGNTVPIVFDVWGTSDLNTFLSCLDSISVQSRMIGIHIQNGGTYNNSFYDEGDYIIHDNKKIVSMSKLRTEITRVESGFNRSTSERKMYAGSIIYHNDTGKIGYVYSDSVELNPDGSVYGVLRSGTTTNRPKGSDIYIGFMYFDTSISPARPIYASTISGDTVTWVDATGQPV